MGRSRRKYGKEIGGVSFDNGGGMKIKVERTEKGYDESNPLILPNKDQRKRKKVVAKKLPKKLSKKQRKHYEKILDQKKKKEKRASLLASLSDVQVRSTELALMDSVAHMGTKNSKLTVLSKRPLPEELKRAVMEIGEKKVDLKGWGGSKRKRSKKEKKLSLEKVKEESSSEEHSSEDDCDDSIKDNVVQDEDKPTCSDDTVTVIENKTQNATDNLENDLVNVEDSGDKIANTEDETATESIKTRRVDNKSSNIQPTNDGSLEIKSEPVTYIHVNRDPEIQSKRLLLPILAEEQRIMEAIKENSVLIICGETGSGKTTQVPQFLYEAGYTKLGMIGITEPRRVAAVNMSKRVAKEMNLPTTQISYQIRYENNVTPETCVKFMTDGVLAREMKEDFLLSKYSVIILDEAHERTANTDVLIGLISRVVPLRNKKGKPLKLVIMSATLRVEDFTKNNVLFKESPPVVQIDVRQFPVTIHFNKITPESLISENSESYVRAAYINETYKKICRIHRTLPGGGMLVFVTGRQEIVALMRKLNQTFPKQVEKKTPQVSENDPTELKEKKEGNNKKETEPVKINLDDYEVKPCDVDVTQSETNKTITHDASDDEDNISDEEIFMDDTAYTEETDSTIPLHVLPLYSLLPSHKQKLVFKQPPHGCRLCVIATNVAETSLTIPGVKYVIDTGKVKRKLYDKRTGVSSFEISWISKASANQRAGRAGRTEPGHAYRLYSSAVFQDFEEFDLPEISTKPVAGLVLNMKAMRIDRVVNFPFPTPPPHEELESAERLLVSLAAVTQPIKNGTLKQIKQARFSGSITPLGQLISNFPVHPRFGKMIAASLKEKELISYVVTIVSVLTVRELFDVPSVDEDTDIDKSQHRHALVRFHHLRVLWCQGGQGGDARRFLGDIMVLLGAIGSAEYEGATPSYCANHYLRPKAIYEIRRLRNQLTNTLNLVCPDINIAITSKMSPPTDKQVERLRQIILSSLGDQVARKIPLDQIPSEKRKAMRNAYQSLLMDEPVYIHPDSIMSKDPCPEYLIFQEVVGSGSGKMYMRDICQIEPTWLPKFCHGYCSFSKPLVTPEPYYDVTNDDVICHVTATYGRLAWKIGQAEISYPIGIDRYRWFACFLLDGLVVTSLKQFVNVLLSRPNTVVKTWANLQPRTNTFLRTLLSKKIDSKAKLCQVWKTKPDYLKTAYLEWIPVSQHDKIKVLWPPH